MIIEFAGITFNNNVADSNGCRWFVTEFEGWGAPAVRQTTVQPTSKDGVIVAQGYSEGRALSVKIVMKAPNETAFWAGFNYLLDNTDNLYDVADFIVTEGTVQKKVGVVRAQETRTRMLGACALEAELSLLAPDPKKYVVE